MHTSVEPDIFDASPFYNIQANMILDAASTQRFFKTLPVKFVKGDWLWFKTNSDNGAALSQMQLKICYNVGNVADCKLRYVKFRDEDSFWFDTVGDNTNDCHSAGNHCAVMGDLDFKINFNCLEEGKIELTFDAETH